MRLAHPTRIYIPSANRERAFVLLHGIRDGIDEPYTQELLDALTLKDQSVTALQYPYMDRCENHTSPELTEETEVLQQTWEFLKKEHYSHITVIAKSLGGIVASHWLKDYPNNDNLDINIMGYVLGDDGVLTEVLSGKLNFVVQGEHDRFGEASAVRAELARYGVNGEVIEIIGADHSYRNPADAKDEPEAYQTQAIDEILKRIL